MTHRPIVLKLVIASVAMFAFGFALVPLYDVFCDLTGLNGKTNRIELVQAENMSVDTGRNISVELLASVNQSRNWEFRPHISSLSVHPGQMHTVSYYVKNNTEADVLARAVPSVSPVKASAYFDKVECFCFDEQLLRAGQEYELPVRFVVKPNLPAEVKTISLAYTFFEITDSATQTTNRYW